MRTRNLPRNKLPGLLISLGIFLFLASLGYNFWQGSVLAFSQPIKYSFYQPQRDETNTPVQIIFPDLKLASDIESGQIKNGLWPLSKTNAIYLTNSALPNEQGRVIIYGHDFLPAFSQIKNLQIGNSVLLKTENSSVFIYKIMSKHTVFPTEISVLAPTSVKILTIYTCTGPIDSQRLVVNASYQGTIL